MTTGLALDNLYRQYGQAPAGSAPRAPKHNGDDFVPDPLPFNYEMPPPPEMDNMQSFDDRYGRKPYEKHPARYGSLLSGMQPYANDGPSQYGDAPSHHMPSHHYADRRDSHGMQHSLNMDRGHPKEAPSSYGYAPHAHSQHPDHEPRQSSHYGNDMHMMAGPHGGSNMHPMYQSAAPSYSGMHSNGHPSSFSAMMDHHPSAKKEVPPPSYHQEYMETSRHAPPQPMPSSSLMSHMGSSAAPSGAQSQNQEAVIKVKTSLKNKYWRNGRRNLQCFPACKVFGDYSQIKIEDLKQHDFMWGKCRGSLIAEVSLNSNATFDDILLLGRVHSLENIPVPFEEAVLRECMIGRVVEPDVMDVIKEQWIPGERLPDFINQNTNLACYEFKPKVWKYTDDMVHGKCKRRNVRYYVQFEAFVPVLTGDRRCYVCIGSGMSSSFEVGSSRVLARQKRKATAMHDDGDHDERDDKSDDENNNANANRPAKAMKVNQGSYPI
ncbi:hypothetical protein SDRG_09155 [Saprolegnia diclina VS20]|uniref:Uncharacterized protein n=1 Tax=Saprolegnia diclina (strain VS20) TaxID=1156394 RepID=T0Q5M3_SAPDV|nr:hypothetical protein SDRG_09155 [Saprolegnia diclina VS20]EQC33169.1 hypothetical protein SDRG_09155 [Saprolegnia diclina VS20]|eukprot:XP_008613292.1 hypothetical protein SDRG_09155 [Saprolegnia diclina VS20]